MIKKMTAHSSACSCPSGLILDYIKPEFMRPGVTVEEAEKLWRIMLVQKAMGRPSAVGPDVPPARVKALRDAFHAALADPDFLAEAEKTQNEINPIDGDELQKLLQIVSSAKPISTNSTTPSALRTRRPPALTIWSQIVVRS